MHAQKKTYSKKHVIVYVTMYLLFSSKHYTSFQFCDTYIKHTGNFAHLFSPPLISSTMIPVLSFTTQNSLFLYLSHINTSKNLILWKLVIIIKLITRKKKEFPRLGHPPKPSPFIYLHSAASSAAPLRRHPSSAVARRWSLAKTPTMGAVLYVQASVCM